MNTDKVSPIKFRIFATSIAPGAAALALITMSLLTGGCKPAETDQPANANTNQPNATGSETTTETESPEAKTEQPKMVDGRFVITGDLASVDWKSLVDKDVTIEGNLVVVDTYDLIRRGQVRVARERLFIPTNQIDPNDADPQGNSFEGGSNVAKVTAAQKKNDAGSITLDDDSDDQDIFPPTLFPNLGKSHPTVRIGSTLGGVSGKVEERSRKFFLIPNQPLEWTPAKRPQRPDVGKADVTVASFNVLNYFTTIDSGSNGARGADSESEFKRQEDKLVAAMMTLDADVIGLMEIENNLEAEKRLVTALNQTAGKDVFRGCGLPAGFNDAPGGKNAIRVGIVYRSDRVKPVGDVAMIKDAAFEDARTPILQTFESNSGGKPFTVIVNHFKSKGGANDADQANKNKGDGQGAHNATRRSQALAICQYIETQNIREPNSRILVIGDLNAYGQEDPIDAMRARGLIDLHEHVQAQSNGSGESRSQYSFIYFGQSGSLDHAMATRAMTSDVTGIATWHINSDEPRFLDYNEENNPASLYQPDPFRSSDHDPVLIGIRN